jgi:hypothetical protein
MQVLRKCQNGVAGKCAQIRKELKLPKKDDALPFMDHLTTKVLLF